MTKLLKFSAAWCTNCKPLKESLKRVDLSGTELIEVDVDENPDLALELKVRGIPLLVLQDSCGNELSRKVGGLSTPQIQQWLDSFK